MSGICWNTKIVTGERNEEPVLRAQKVLNEIYKNAVSGYGMKSRKRCSKRISDLETEIRQTNVIFYVWKTGISS